MGGDTLLLPLSLVAHVRRARRLGVTGVFHRKRDFQQSLLWLRPDVGDAEVRQLTAPTLS
jgi:hypothetical protein